MTAAVIIPFRDRGVDPLRAVNLRRVLTHWEGFAQTLVVDDGRSGKANFNRSAAYNRGAAATDANVLVFSEADMLIDLHQISEAVALAGEQPGLVVPFTHQRKLTPPDSGLVRAYLKEAADCVPDHHPYGETSNYGCINVISRDTLAAVGRYDETFSGHGHDDNAMWRAFNVAAGPTRWVDGPAYHLYHLDFDPVTAPDAGHITEEDRQAQERNFRRMQLYHHARTAEEIRILTAGGQSLSRNWRTRWLGNNGG